MKVQDGTGGKQHDQHPIGHRVRRPGTAGKGSCGEDDCTSDEDREGERTQTGIELIFKDKLCGKQDPKNDTNDVRECKTVKESHNLIRPAAGRRGDGKGCGLAA